MAKILILANNDLGLYKFRKELIYELAKENDVFISLPNGNLVSKLEELGCKFLETPLSRRGMNPLADLKLLKKYRQILRDNQPDVVLTYTIKPNIYGGLACQLEKVPYLSNITGLGTAVENKGLLQKITSFLYKLALKKSKCVFFQNEENLNFFKENNMYSGNKRLIPGSGVNLNEYSLLKYPTDNIVRFLFIARVMKEKGIDQYLKAAQFIKNKYPKTEFHILGFCEQDYKEKLNDFHAKGIIVYHGLQNDIIPFHAQSSCTIHPTYYPEGMSNVLLESAALGRPIITTDKSGCKEIIENGKNGYLIRQRSSSDLIEKIEDFISLSYEEKEKMGLSGRVKIEKEFNREIVIKVYLDEIKKILS